ncbi:alpha/beta fold hydrolase [Actinomyces sp. ZJ308]|uniref:alpha/beta fold hydrolase n=1 Tax=Actinomyces sp. ZJ308 TaxID=2708342 RepID=UPI0014200CF7|nr:alpha/beta fold hydrolase [Actinomyces sp. ZJ308]
MTSLARIVAGADAAPTLVLLHGITGSAVSLAEAIDHWVGGGYRVVAVDARGHGLSPRWEPAQLERAGEVLVEDLIAVLEGLATDSRGRAALGLAAPPAPVVIGHSMGAATAMVAAGRRPDLVTGVVLEDPARFGTRSPCELLARGAARERARAAEVADLPAAVGRALETMPDVEALPGVWASQRTDPGLLLAGVVTPEVRWEEAMAALDVPALLLTGDRPGSARVGREGLATAAGNPRITPVLVPDAGHQVRRSDPEAFYRTVDAWLTEVLPVG